MANFDTENAGFNPNLRMLETSDPCHADTFNALFKQLINNDVAIMEASSGMFSSKNEQALFLLNLHKDGKKYGVFFNDFSISASSKGTRLHDASGLVAYPSTNTERKQNDFEGVSVFYHIEVNGYVDADGEFQVEYIAGIDDEFDRYEKDTWCLFLPQWISISIDAYGETKILSDTKFPGSFIEGGAIRTDGTHRPFIAIAKYPDSGASTDQMNTVSGKSPSYNNSHNSLLTKARRGGTQYCATTSHDLERMNNLFDVAFATRHSQSIMAGNTDNNRQYAVSVVETDVERVVLTKTQAAYFHVGECVSIGNSERVASSGTSMDIDRYYAPMHAKADRVLITAIETYDEGLVAIYVDNGGNTFDTASKQVSGIESKTYISSMPAWTGSCDGVLGSCGSVNNNTNGRNPYLLFGVEYGHGQYEVLGNTIVYIADNEMHAYTVYDCTKAATGAPTSDYEMVSYTIPSNGGSWKYIAELGFDPDHPSVRLASATGASSSTGYADGVYTEDYTGKTGAREVLCFGTLINGTPAGRRCEPLNVGVSTANWYYGARLSASGRCSAA